MKNTQMFKTKTAKTALAIGSLAALINVSTYFTTKLYAREGYSVDDLEKKWDGRMVVLAGNEADSEFKELYMTGCKHWTDNHESERRTLERVGITPKAYCESEFESNHKASMQYRDSFIDQLACEPVLHDQRTRVLVECKDGSKLRIKEETQNRIDKAYGAVFDTIQFVGTPGFNQAIRELRKKH